MKVFKTGKLPVHIALTELYDDATPEEVERIIVQDEIAQCYSVYTPAQNINIEVNSAQVQEEIDQSWELHNAEEEGKSVRQKVDEVTELEWFDNECLSDSKETGADADTINDYAGAKLSESYHCADRRRKTRRSKNRFRASVITAFNNSKRFEDDEHSKVIRNQRHITKPKKQTSKFTRLVKLAEKMKLIPVGKYR